MTYLGVIYFFSTVLLEIFWVNAILLDYFEFLRVDIYVDKTRWVGGLKFAIFVNI